MSLFYAGGLAVCSGREMLRHDFRRHNLFEEYIYVELTVSISLRLVAHRASFIHQTMKYLLALVSDCRILHCICYRPTVSISVRRRFSDEDTTRNHTLLFLVLRSNTICCFYTKSVVAMYSRRMSPKISRMFYPHDAVCDMVLFYFIRIRCEGKRKYTRWTLPKATNAMQHRDQLMP